MKPYRPFEQPSDIIADPDLSNAEKSELLIQWQRELVERQAAANGTAANHNGQPPADAPDDAESGMLARVRLCLAALKDGPGLVQWDSADTPSVRPDEPDRRTARSRSSGGVPEDV